MSMKVYELNNKKELEVAMEFVFKNFCETEKPFYDNQEYVYATKSLKTYDIFNLDEIEKHIFSGAVKVFAVFMDAKILAVSALRLDGGKILFLSMVNSDDGMGASEVLLDKMVETVKTSKDRKLSLLAFVGQEKALVSLGFMKINSSVFKFFGVKFIAMTYDYAQIDIEI